jgi:hypothetical protein
MDNNLFYSSDPEISEQQRRAEREQFPLTQPRPKLTRTMSLNNPPPRPIYPRQLTNREREAAWWESFLQNGVRWNHRQAERDLRGRVRSVRDLRGEDRRVQDIRDQVLGDHPHRGDVLRYLSSRDQALRDEALREKARRDEARDIWPLSKSHSKRVNSQNSEATIRYSPTASTQGSNLLLESNQFSPRFSPRTNNQPSPSPNDLRPSYPKLNLYPRRRNNTRNNRNRKSRSRSRNRPSK